MPLSYQDIGATVNDVNFQNRIVGALEATCIIVNGEAGGTANHAVRLTLMGRIVVDPVSYARKFAPLIASVSPLSGLANVLVATDAQILSAVSAVFDALALLGV